MKRSRLLISILATIAILMLAGCSQKATLTRDQQDNVVRGIVKNYNIEIIKFTKFSKDLKTGSYHLLFTINNNERYKTGITVSEISEFDERLDNIGLSPIDDFAALEKKIPLNDNDEVNISSIKIEYLGE